MKNHGIIPADWQLKAASEKRLRAIMLPMQPQPKALNGAWWWHPEMTAYCQSEHWAKVYQKLPYQIGDTVYFQEDWYPVEREGRLVNCFTPGLSTNWDVWKLAHTMPIEASRHKFLVTDVRVLQMRDLCLTRIVLRRKLGWLTTESNPRRIKQDWEAAWNTQFPDYPYHSNLFVTILSVEPSEC